MRTWCRFATWPFRSRKHWAVLSHSRTSASADKRDYRVDFTKIGRLLPSFRPQWTVAQGIAELAADMRQFGLSTEDFEGPRFVRLARIRQLLADGRLDDELRIPSPQGATR